MSVRTSVRAGGRACGCPSANRACAREPMGTGASPGEKAAIAQGATPQENAKYKDWANLSEKEYLHDKNYLEQTTIDALDKYVPGIRKKIDHLEASTPKTFKHYTLHPSGTSFGTKFEGLQVSRDLPKQIKGLFHAGSVGIIMSGWLGAANYGVIVANETDKFFRELKPSLVTV